MTDPEVVVTSSNHPVAAWPHAIVDCLTTSPCSSCYCYVCDVPIAQCDDPVGHAAADGRRDVWNTVKRRRRALVDTWADIPALVNHIVSLSVEEAVRRASSRSATTPNDVQLITDAFEHAVSIKHDTPIISPNKAQVPTVTTPKVEGVQVRAASIIEKEPC